MPYYICEFCSRAIKTHEFDRHRKKAHPNETSKKPDPERLKKILDESKNSDPSAGRDPFSLWFEVAKRVFSEIEEVDTSSYTYIYDYQVKEFLERTKPTTHPPHPPIMIHVKGVIKDQKIYDKLLKKYKGTRMENFLRDMIRGTHPVVIVCKENYTNLLSEWRREGRTVSDVMILTVFFYLHEMYHISRYGERDSDVKAANAVLDIFGHRIGIPDYEIERWKEDRRFREKLRKKKRGV